MLLLLPFSSSAERQRNDSFRVTRLLSAECGIRGSPSMLQSPVWDASLVLGDAHCGDSSMSDSHILTDFTVSVGFGKQSREEKFPLQSLSVVKKWVKPGQGSWFLAVSLILF